MKVLPLHAGNPSPMTGAGNWTYLVDGPRPLLIDAGVGEPDHLAAVAAATREGPHGVLVTHAHSDHASGAKVLAERWPDARFAKYPWPGRDDRYPVPWAALTNGARVDTGEATLHVIHTPGHAPDHVVLWNQDTRVAFTGDLLVLGSTVVIPASGGGDLLDYLESLKRVLALDPVRLLPAHGDPVEDPAALIDHYLDHRRLREAQVLAALDQGDDTVEAMVERIYRGLRPELRPMAKESVLAHLGKLEREHRVSRLDDRWRLVNER